MFIRPSGVGVGGWLVAQPLEDPFSGGSKPIFVNTPSFYSIFCLTRFRNFRIPNLQIFFFVCVCVVSHNFEEMYGFEEFP